VRVGIDVTPLLRQRTGIAVCTELLLGLVKAAGHEPVGLLSGYRTLDGKVPDLGIPLRRNWVPWLADRLFTDLLRRPTVEDMLGRVGAYIATNHVVLPARSARNIALVHDVGRLTHPHLYGSRQVWRFQILARRLARFADTIVVPTEAVARELVGLGISARDRIHVVPWFARVLPANGASLPSGVPGDRPLILCVATLERRKNIPHLVRAFQRAAHALPHHLVLAGGAGPSLEEALAVARSNGASDRIHFIGHAGAEQLGVLYRSADLAVCPSLYEGFGLPLVEAMAHGCPVMASDIPVHREVGGDAIRLVPADDEDALVEGLVDLSKDQGARLALRRLGLERTRDFSPDRTRRLFSEVFSWRSAP
jgi:glycosyltransferase involved in cell wall biosynthesis